MLTCTVIILCQLLKHFIKVYSKTNNDKEGATTKQFLEKTPKKPDNNHRHLWTGRTHKESLKKRTRRIGFSNDDEILTNNQEKLEKQFIEA